MAFITNPLFLHSLEVEAAVEPIGREVVDLAKELAPKRTEHLANSIKGEWVIEDGRKVYRVAAHDFKGGWIEFGTINMDAEPYLGPAAAQVVGNLE